MDDIDPDAHRRCRSTKRHERATDRHAIGIGGAVLGYAEAGSPVRRTPVVVGFGLLTGIAVAVVEHDASRASIRRSPHWRRSSCLPGLLPAS